MFLPVALVFFAALAAAMLAYGTDAGWAQFHHGINFILWSRRLQWPLIAITLLLCLALLVLIISGKRRAWWLLALSPILALFVHRFATDPARDALVVEDPPFIEARADNYFRAGDYVVGIRVGDLAYAFPYSVLFHSPVVIFSNRQQRVIVLWSPFANRALAFAINHDLSARDLEVVSSPANATLLYDSKDGQFINSLTGRSPRNDPVTDFREQLPVSKLRWTAWVRLHPDTKVMAPLDNRWLTAPGEPILPKYPLPRNNPDFRDDRRTCMIATTQPIAFSADLIAAAPLNLTAAKTPVVIICGENQIRAFDRHVEEDLTPRFFSSTDPKHPAAVMSDLDTSTQWSIDGVAIDGPKETHNEKLRSIPVETDLYWGIMKYWYPNLQWIDAGTVSAAVQASPAPANPLKPVPIKRHRTNHPHG